MQSAKTVDVPPEARFGDDATALQEGEQISGVVVHAEPTFGFILTHKGKLFFSPSSCPTAGKGSTVTCVVQQGQKGARANRVSVVAGAVAPPKSSVPDALVAQCRCQIFTTEFQFLRTDTVYRRCGNVENLPTGQKIIRLAGVELLIAAHDVVENAQMIQIPQTPTFTSDKEVIRGVIDMVNKDKGFAFASTHKGRVFVGLNPQMGWLSKGIVVEFTAVQSDKVGGGV